MKSFIEIFKSKRFWGGFLTALGGVLTGAVTMPEAVMSIISLFGG